MTVYPTRPDRTRRAIDIALMIIDHAGFATLAFAALMAIAISPVYWW